MKVIINFITNVELFSKQLGFIKSWDLDEVIFLLSFPTPSHTFQSLHFLYFNTQQYLSYKPSGTKTPTRSSLAGPKFINVLVPLDPWAAMHFGWSIVPPLQKLLHIIDTQCRCTHVEYSLHIVEKSVYWLCSNNPVDSIWPLSLSSIKLSSKCDKHCKRNVCKIKSPH